MLCSYDDLCYIMGALKMRDWKMRDWNYREQETYGTPRVAQPSFFVTVCTVIGISTWYTYEHRVIPAHLKHGQCRN